MYALILTVASLVCPYLGSTVFPLITIILVYLYLFSTTDMYQYQKIIPIVVCGVLLAVYNNAPDMTDVVYTVVAVGMMIATIRRVKDMRCRMFAAIAFVSFLNITLISPALREDTILPLLIAMQVTILVQMSWLLTKK
jgi:hypothetical protein